MLDDEEVEFGEFVGCLGCWGYESCVKGYGVESWKDIRRSTKAKRNSRQIQFKMQPLQRSQRW